MAVPAVIAGILPWLGRAVAGIGSWFAAARIGKAVSTTAKVGKAIAPYALGAGAVGSIEKLAKAQTTKAQVPKVEIPSRRRISEYQYPMTDRMHKREIALAREEMWLSSIRDLGITALRHPTIGFVSAIVSIDMLEKFSIIEPSTAQLLKTVVVTDVGIKSASVLIDAIIPG